MQKPWWSIGLMASIILIHSGVAIAADQERSRQNVQQQQGERIYGSQLMSEQERLDFRSRMSSAKSLEEQEKIRSEHHEQMKLRAAERGVSLPDQMPARGGRGMGPRSLVPIGPQLAKAGTAEPGSQNPEMIAYVSGGIGDDDPLLQTTENYNLHLVFAMQESGEYLADIKVLIEDTKGKKILEADSPGPLFYVRLPSGNYRVTAAYNGNSLRKQITLKERSSRDLYFHWPNEIVATNKGTS